MTLAKSEQWAVSRNSRNRSRNMETPMGSRFYIDVPTVPTKNRHSFIGATHTHERLTCVCHARIYGVSPKKVGKSEQSASKPLVMRFFMFRLAFRLIRLIRLAGAGGTA